MSLRSFTRAAGFALSLTAVCGTWLRGSGQEQDTGRRAAATAPSAASRASDMPRIGSGDLITPDPVIDLARQVYVSGRVVMSDGSAVPPDVQVTCSCSSTRLVSGTADGKGRFSLALSDNAVGGAESDPSVRRSERRSGNVNRGVKLCEVRAALAGFQSTVLTVTLTSRLDFPDAGTIVLHRLANVEGSAVSLLDLQAPKDAQTAYKKGLQASRRRDWRGAERQLGKAVQLSPKYSSAWFALGRAFQAQGNLRRARLAYESAIEADPKFTSPYLPLAAISFEEQKWYEVEATTARLLQLDPDSFPLGYLYNAIANLNLGALDAAETSVRESIRRTAAHDLPAGEHILGLILMNKNDYAGAVQHFRNYLEKAPNALDADSVRKRLSEIQQQARHEAPGH